MLLAVPSSLLQALAACCVAGPCSLTPSTGSTEHSWQLPLWASDGLCSMLQQMHSLRLINTINPASHQACSVLFCRCMLCTSR